MLQVPIFIMVFLTGLIVGSFLNCVIYRLETGGTPFKGRSFCPRCKTTLRWYDLIPVLSFFWLRSRCRYCEKSISRQYPLVEMSTALIFLQIFNFSVQDGPSSGWYHVFYFLIASFLIIIFVYDLKHYIIPDKVIFPAILVAGIWQSVASVLNLIPISYFLTAIYSAFGAALFFLAIVLITKGKGMGAGDIKLAFLMGLILGWPKILVALFLAFFLGAATGLFLIAFKKKTMKSEVPFGPFLITGVFLALFFGEKIMNWYLGLFLLR